MMHHECHIVDLSVVLRGIDHHLLLLLHWKESKILFSAFSLQGCLNLTEVVHFGAQAAAAKLAGTKICVALWKGSG